MAIAVAQQVSNPAAGSGLSNATATTQTISITPSAGSALVVLARGQGGANAVTVADPTNGSYTALDADNDGNANWATFVKQNVAGSTVTITGTWASTNANRGLIVLEISAAATSGGAQTHVVGTTANTTPSMTPTSQPALVVGFGCTEGGSTMSAGTGFTGGTRVWATSGDGILPVNQRITSTSAIAATWTGGSGGDRYFGIVLSEAAAGGNTMTVAATSPVSTMAASLASTDILAVAATSPVSTMAGSLASTDSLAIATTSPVSTMAAALAIVQNTVAIAATSPVSTLAAALASTDLMAIAATSPVATLAALLNVTAPPVAPAITMPIPYTARMI
jgi:hypothetical protein